MRHANYSEKSIDITLELISYRNWLRWDKESTEQDIMMKVFSVFSNHNRILSVFKLCPTNLAMDHSKFFRSFKKHVTMPRCPVLIISRKLNYKQPIVFREENKIVTWNFTPRLIRGCWIRKSRFQNLFSTFTHNYPQKDWKLKHLKFDKYLQFKGKNRSKNLQDPKNWRWSYTWCF